MQNKIIELQMSEMSGVDNSKFIKITIANYNALDKTLEYIKHRIECQNRKPSVKEQIAINVLGKEIKEIKSVLQLY